MEGRRKRVEEEGKGGREADRRWGEKRVVIEMECMPFTKINSMWTTDPDINAKPLMTPKITKQKHTHKQNNQTLRVLF